jgi:hypothetical protein
MEGTTLAGEDDDDDDDDAIGLGGLMDPLRSHPAARSSLIPIKERRRGGRLFEGESAIGLGQVLGRPWVNMLKRQYQRRLAAELQAM